MYHGKSLEGWFFRTNNVSKGIPPLFFAIAAIHIAPLQTWKLVAESYFPILERLISAGADVEARRQFSFSEYRDHSVMKRFELGNAVDFCGFLQMLSCDRQKRNWKEVIGKLRANDKTANKVSNSKQVDLYEKLLNNDKFSDVVIVTKSGSIHQNTETRVLHAHRAILAAASPYYECMFSGAFAESGGTVKMEFSFEVMKAILGYIYTGKIDPTILQELAGSMLDAARLLLLGHLESLCVRAVLDRLTVENIRDELVLAYAHDHAAVKEGCFVFIKDRALQVLTRPEVAALSVVNTALWSEMQEAVSKKVDCVLVFSEVDLEGGKYDCSVNISESSDDDNDD